MVTDDNAISASALRLSRTASRAYSSMLRDLLDRVGEALLLVDAGGEVLLYNRPFEQLAGVGTLDRHIGMGVRDAFSILGATLEESELGDLLASAAGSQTLELRGARTALCRVVAVPFEGSGDGRMIALREVTHERREVEQLEHRAFHDHLTGLPNRDLLLDRLEGMLSRQGRDGGAIGVAFLDLDGFKDVNDTYGHAAGDAVLVDVAARLLVAMRDADSVGRFGGDEFVIVCHGLEDEPTLVEICSRIQDAVARPYRLAQGEVTLTTSLGAILEWDHGVRPMHLIERADALMYAAKRRGSGREILVEGWRGQGIRRARSARAVREAFDAGQLVLSYLPIVALEDRRTVAVEGLLRCCHPELAMLGTAELLELIEQTTLMRRLSEWSLGEAAHAARLLHEEAGAALPVIVSLSALQLADTALPGMVSGVASSQDLELRSLGFDIGERVIAANPPYLGSAVGALSALGCPLFANGVVNPKVAAEQILTPQFVGIKLEASIIRRCADDANLAERTQAGVRFARSRELSVIGVGVDDEQHLATVHALGCDHAEGYGFYGFPRAIGDLARLLR